MARLTLQITKLEESLNIKQGEMKESHLTEMRLWKHRCTEKNVLIQLLARRIAHLSATDVEGHFINGILTEIRKLEKEFAKNSAPPPAPHQQQNHHHHLSLGERSHKKNEIFSSSLRDFSFNTLRSFLASERQRVLVNILITLRLLLSHCFSYFASREELESQSFNLTLNF